MSSGGSDGCATALREVSAGNLRRVSARSTNQWSNWAGNQSCVPARVERPTSEAELSALVELARAQRLGVRAVGAGHSFTATVVTDGVLVDLDGYGELEWVDREAGQVRVQAGIPLHRLNDLLAERGLALPNLGDINYQSIAGATQTATHGTGLGFRNISSAIIGMRIVDGRGAVIECGPENNADVFTSARAAVGALGLVSTVTLQCVPAFNLHAVEGAEPVDEVLESIDELAEENDHFEFFWIPNTRWALTKRNRRTHEPARPRTRWQEVYQDIVCDNLAFDLMMRIGRFRNDLIPKVAKRMPSKGPVDFIDRSDKVFTSPRLVRFVEMEYAIPRAALTEALNRVRAMVAGGGRYIGFPVEVRFTQGDDIPLSTAEGRDTCYIAVHVYKGTPHHDYFTGVERIMNDYDGRPHWGKLHFQTAETLAPRYPRWNEFQAVRATLDPDGIFTNTYVRRVLGPPPA
jgi:FAD-linked oxidoreductase